MSFPRKANLSILTNQLRQNHNWSKDGRSTRGNTLSDDTNEWRNKCFYVKVKEKFCKEGTVYVGRKFKEMERVTMYDLKI